MIRMTSHPHVAKEDGLQPWWACMAPATAALGEARKFPSKPVHWERMGGTVGAVSLWLLRKCPYQTTELLLRL